MSSILDFFDEIKLYIMGSLAVVAIVSIGIAVHEHGLYTKEVQLRISDQASYKQAQADATTLALIEKKKEEDKDNAAKDSADAQYAALQSSYTAQLRAYAALKGKPSTTNLPIQADSPKEPDGPSGDTLIPVSYSDLLICKDNTAKAVVAHDYILSITSP